MNGAEKASWTNTSGTHTLEVCEAFTQLPKSKPASSQRVATDDQAIATGAPLTQGEPFQVAMNTSSSHAFANLPISVPQDKILVIQSASVRPAFPPHAPAIIWTFSTLLFKDVARKRPAAASGGSV